MIEMLVINASEDTPLGDVIGDFTGEVTIPGC